MAHDLGVRTLQLFDDLEALVKLGEDVHHGAGEQGMLRCLLELQEGTGWTTASTPGRSGPRDGGGLAGGCPEEGTHKQDMDNGHHQPRATTQCLLTPSFLSRSSAPCRKSRDTSSFSSNHWMTKGSNHLEENSSSGTPLRLYGQPCPTRWLPILLLKW